MSSLVFNSLFGLFFSLTRRLIYFLFCFQKLLFIFLDYLAFSVFQPFFIDFLNPCYLLTNSLSHIFLHRFYLVFVIFPHFLNINQMLFLSNFIGILKLVNFLSCFLFQLKYLLFVHPSKLGAIFFELELQFLVAFFELPTLL